jgi:hemolysin activation/secretion protein
VAALEDYAAQLSRHTGRRVDAELAPGRRPGTSDVNLRIAETRPWKVYAQYTNTGTSGTTKNRERFGFAHDQLLSRDDSLRVDYTTGDFDEVHVVSGSYEAPFSLAAPAYRYRLRGLYSEFDASEVAIIDSSPGTVHGEQVLGEGTLIANLFQRGEFFVDLLAGARYQQLHVDQEEILGGNNPQQAEKATVDYVVPSVGVLGERNTTTSRLRLSVDADAGFTDAGWEDRRVLGNDETAKDFALLRWDGSYSFYLEPLLDRFAWEDPGTPESSTLAHEIAVALRGQWAFDQRLVPYYQQVAGGFFTVRGYKQSSVAGDTVVLGSAEYRLHLPRIFAPDSEPPRLPLFGPFRVRPESVYGRPDWDLILRLFSDAAQVWVSDPMDAETDETLVSLGGGIEMQLLQNLSLRFDAGHVLSDAGSSEQGDTRGHVMATLVY